MKKVLLGILIGIILGCGGYFGYDYFFKEKEVEEIKEEEKIDVDSENKDYNKYVTSQFSGTSVLPWPLEKTETDPDFVTKKADIPKIVIDNDEAKALNEKMYKLYESTIDEIKNNKSEGKMATFDVEIDYDFAIKDDIIFIKINYKNGSSRSGSNYEYHGFYYDLKTNKELTSQEIASKYNITVEKINAALVASGYDKTVTDLSNTMFPSGSKINVILVGNIDTPTIEVTIN